MIRRSVTVLGVFVLGLLAAAQAAWADYVPVPASNVPVTTTPAQSGASGSLSYTGAGFNVAGTVAIAAAVLVIGALLCLFGARLARGGRH